MSKVIYYPFILLAGCAGMPETQCASDWYQRGESEALMGNRARAEQYAQCNGFREQDYLAGWSIGYSEWNRRVSGSRM
jgi:hypothetical protein